MPRDPNDKRPTGDLPVYTCSCASVVSAVLAFVSSWLNYSVGPWLWLPVLALILVFGFVSGWLGIIAGKHSWNWIGVAIAALGMSLHGIAILYSIYVLVSSLNS